MLTNKQFGQVTVGIQSLKQDTFIRKLKHIFSRGGNENTKRAHISSQEVS